MTYLSNVLSNERTHWKKLDSKDSNYYFNRGNVKLARGQHTKAVGDFRIALELDPTCAKYYHSMGLVHQSDPQEGYTH